MGALGRGAFAVGASCGSGTHRSVSVIEVLADRLRSTGVRVQVRHLDIRDPREGRGRGGGGGGWGGRRRMGEGGMGGYY